MLDIDHQILDIAGRFYLLPGTREQAIRDETGMTSTRYYQVLNRLIDDPEACQEYPELTGRLRRQRDRQASQRRTRPTACPGDRDVPVADMVG